MVRWLVRLLAGAVVGVLVLTGGGAFAALPFGPDVASYQHAGALNWSKVRSTGARFAFIKATEGGGYTNPWFKGDWSGSAQAGLYHGAYHFARPSVGSAAAQATHFVQVIGPQKVPGTLPPVLDLEATGGLNPGQLITWVRTFLTTVQNQTGRNPMIYVSPSFWQRCMRNSTGFHGYPLWIAHYGVSQPTVPGGWPTWSFWQSTSSARITGISGNVDRDVFNGNLTQLQKFALAYSRLSTSLTLAAGNPKPTTGQSVTFSGTLLDSSGAPAAARTVNLAVRAPGSQTFTKVGSATTSARGVYSIRSTVTSAGTYQATFPGDSNLKASTSPLSNVTLTPLATTAGLATSADRTWAGTTVTLSGSLAAGTSTKLAGRSVAIMRQPAGSSTWSVLTRVTTDSTGGFSTAAKMMTSATYKAQFAGEPAYAPTASSTVPVTVSLSPTTASLKVSNTAPYANRYVTMSGSLTSNRTPADATTEQPVAGRAVTLYRQLPGSTSWTSVARLTTDATGHYTTSQLVDRAASYKVAFPGDSLYATSTSPTSAVSITPPTPTRFALSAASSQSRTLRKGRSLLVSGSLLTSTGTPVVDRRVGLWKRDAGTTGWHWVARTATAQPSGRWEFRVQPTRTCSYKVAFVGGTRYAAATSREMRVRVN